MSNVGDNIRRAREKLGWTQDELARRMGYKSKSTINKIELGINDMPQSKIVQYAEVLGVSPSYLMGWVDEETNKKNDSLAEAIVKMRRHPDLSETIYKVISLYEQSPEKFASVDHILSGLVDK